jgi:hypothetical protein
MLNQKVMSEGVHFRRAQNLQEAERIYNARELYRKIHCQIKHALPPETVHEMGRYLWDVEDRLTNYVIELMGMISKKVEKELIKGMFRYQTIDKLEIYYNELLNRLSRLDEPQKEILYLIRNLLNKSKQFLQSLKRKMGEIKSGLVKRYIGYEDLSHYQSEFVAEVQRRIPNIDYDYSNNLSFWIQPDDIKKFETILKNFKFIADLYIIKVRNRWK